MAPSITERLGIRTFDPGSQLESIGVEFDPRSGEMRVAVVDGEVISDEDEAWRKAGLVYMRGLGGDVIKKRRWIFWRPNRRLKKLRFVGEK